MHPNGFDRNYVLDADGQPRVEPDIDAWDAWWSQAHTDPRHPTTGYQIAYTRMTCAVYVSTSLLNTALGDPPEMLETMVFDRAAGPFDRLQIRDVSRTAAEATHARVAGAIGKFLRGELDSWSALDEAIYGQPEPCPVCGPDGCAGHTDKQCNFHNKHGQRCELGSKHWPDQPCQFAVLPTTGEILLAQEARASLAIDRNGDGQTYSLGGES